MKISTTTSYLPVPNDHAEIDSSHPPTWPTFPRSISSHPRVPIRAVLAGRCAVGWRMRCRMGTGGWMVDIVLGRLAVGMPWLIDWLIGWTWVLVSDGNECYSYERVGASVDDSRVAPGAATSGFSPWSIGKIMMGRRWYWWQFVSTYLDT